MTASIVEIRTRRLLLRPWRESDLQPFAAMNQDPEVMKFFPVVLDRKQSDRLAEEIQRRIDDQGWGFWVVEIPGEAPFIGFTGLNTVREELPFAPGVEIGWRLSRKFRGNGYASEAAPAALETGFRQLRLQEIVAFTASENRRSRAEMERIGMVFENETFDQPVVAPGHPLRKHVLYRMKNPVTAFPPR